MEGRQKFYAELSVEFHADSEPQAMVAARNIVAAFEREFGAKVYLNDIRHKYSRQYEYKEKSIIKTNE